MFFTHKMTSRNSGLHASSFHTAAAAMCTLSHLTPGRGCQELRTPRAEMGQPFRCPVKSNLCLSLRCYLAHEVVNLRFLFHGGVHSDLYICPSLLHLPISPIQKTVLTHIHNLPYRFTMKLKILLSSPSPFLKLRVIWLRNSLAYIGIFSSGIQIVLWHCVLPQLL